MSAADGIDPAARSDRDACGVCGGWVFDSAITGIQDWEFGFPGRFDYRRCRTCGQTQLWPFPSLEDLRRAYGRDYTLFTEGENARGTLFAVLARLNAMLAEAAYRKALAPGTRALDVGCGNGIFLQRLRDQFGIDGTGIDFSEIAVSLTRQRGIRATHGTFLDAELQLESFDFIFMNHYLEHVIRPTAELKRAFDVLRPGGMIFGEMPNFDAIERRWFGPYWGGNHAPRHTFQFTPALLRKRLVDAGFEGVAVRHGFNPGQLALSIQNTVVASKARRTGGIVPPPHGRWKAFPILLLMLVPVQVLFSLLGRGGIIHFSARKPSR